MKKVRITVKKKARYEDLMAEYENPIEHACAMELGQTFVCNGWERPEGFCESAWETVSQFVMTLAVVVGQNQSVGRDYLARATTSKDAHSILEGYAIRVVNVRGIKF